MKRATRLLLVCWCCCLLIRVHCTGARNSGGFKSHSSDPFDTLPKNFWFDYSSPLTENYDELTESEPKTTPEPLPYFDEYANSTNVTVQFGESVYLPCKVNDLREKTVSWVRRKDDQLHLITFGVHTYSSDSRYALDYHPPNDWRLFIQYANERDEGNYECQVSSHPPVVFYVHLHVIVPRVDIVDERGDPLPDKFYKAGSTIELKCVVSQIPEPSAHITWRHGLRMLNYDTLRGGISVKTNKIPGGALSRLFIANANKHDSGNYTCSLADYATTSIQIHVLNGETPAAMQHGSGPTHDVTSPGIQFLCLWLLYVYWR